MSSLKLLGKKSFGPLFITQFLGAFNDNLFKNAMVVAVALNSISVFGYPPEQTVALAGGVFILPFFLFSSFAGQLSDKFEKNKVLQVTKFFEILIMLFSAYALIINDFEMLMITLFFMGLQSSFFGPAKFSILPELLDDTELVSGNAFIEAGTFLSILLGTIAGGVLINLQYGREILAALLVAISLLGFVSSLKIISTKASEPELIIDWNIFTTTWQNLKFAKQNQTVFLSILGISWFWFLGAIVLSVIPILCKNIFQSDEGLITLFLTVFSVGIGIGSILCEKLSYKRLELGLVPLGSFGMTLFTLILYLKIKNYTNGPDSVWNFAQSYDGIVILTGFLGLAITGGFFIVPLQTLIQQRADKSTLSRVISASNIMSSLFMVGASIFLFLFLKYNFSLAYLFLTLAFFNGLAAIYVYTLLPEFMLRFCAWALARIIYRIKVTGDQAFISESKGLILVCNHVSFVDWLIISAAIRRPVSFVMTHEFFKGYFLKKFLTQAKVIPIAPAKENIEIYNQAFDLIKDKLKSGGVVCIFPEGKITHDGEMNEFKPGLLKILETTPVSVVPVSISGMWGSFFSRKDKILKHKRPRKLWSKIKVKIGNPVSPVNLNLEELKNTVLQLRESK